MKAAKLAARRPVTVVGDTVVAARDSCRWFETKPLFGWRVLVPRTKEQAGALSDQLRVVRRGAARRCRPSRSSRRAPRSRWSGRSRAWSTGRYEWVAFTSRQRGQGGPGEVRGVRPRRPRLRRHQGRRRRRADRRGAASRSASSPTWCPSGEQSAAGLLEDWPPYDAGLRPDRPGVPAARRHRHRDPGRRADRAAAGRSTTSRPTAPCAPRRRPRRSARRSRAAASTRCSSPRPRRCATWSASPASRTPSTVIACIGPATAKTAEEHGLRVDVLAAVAVGRRRWPRRSPSTAPALRGRRPVDGRASRCCARRSKRADRPPQGAR